MLSFSTIDGVFVEDDSVIPYVGDVLFCEASQDALADLSYSSDLSSTFIDTNGVLTAYDLQMLQGQ